MRLQLPIGISDFRELREKKLEYIDKSGLLIEMIDRAGTKVRVQRVEAEDGT